MATPSKPQPELDTLSPANRLLLDRMVEAMSRLAPSVGAMRDLPVVTVSPAGLLEACRIAKESPVLNANLLLCLACVDYQEYFQLVYFLRSLGGHEQPGATMVIKANLPYEEPRAPSVAQVWRAAEWYEREAHDLFGVSFEGSPNMTPLLLYEEFEGYPGRKEFPLNDYQEF